MTFNEARDLRIGEKVKTKNGDELEVYMLNEFISFDGKKTIFVKCKTENGGIMKLGHKQLIRL